MIISITPSSAALIHESTASPFVSDEVEERTLTSVNGELNEIQGYTSSLNSSWEYVKCRAGDYNWKFWKWPEITADILGSLKNMLATVEMMKGPAEKIKTDADLLKQIEEQNIQTNTKTADTISYDNKNMSDMVDELSKRLKTNITTHNISANEVKNGDVVQYMSNKSYARYLSVVDLETSNTVKQKRSDIPCYTAFLGGTGNNVVSLGLPSTVQEISFEKNYSVDNKTLVRTAAQIQQEEIDKIREKGNNKKWHADNLLIALKVIGGTAATLIAIGGGLALIGTGLFFTVIGTAASPFVIIAGGVIALFGVGLYPYVLALGIAYYIVNKQANSLLKEAKQKQEDLDKWTQNKEIKQENMNLSTYMEIFLVKHPSMENWKEMHPILVKGPEHGKVLFGPGLQFLYGPDKEYTGNDTFTFVYVKEGQTDCETTGQINVNIQINSIPIFTMPGEA